MQDKLVGFIAITDAERSRRFYVDALGLEFVADDGFAVVLRSGGNMVRLAKVPSVSPAPYTVLGWECADLSARVRQLTGLGVRFERYDWAQQDEHGIWTAPDGDRIAWMRDPDGHVLSVSQHA